MVSKKLIATAVAAAFFSSAAVYANTASAAQASEGATASAGQGAPGLRNCKAFFHGALHPSDLADRIDETLDREQKLPGYSGTLTGKLLLDQGKCKLDGSCGTPALFFDAIRKAITKPYLLAGKPMPVVTLRDVPKYLRTLVERRGPTGTHKVSGIRYDANGEPYVDMECVIREIADLVFVDPEINLAILDKFCVNPFADPMPPPVAKAPLISRPEPPVAKAPPTYAPGGNANCPAGYSVIANAWTYESIAAVPRLREDLATLVAAAKAADIQRAMNLQAYRGPRMSRTMGRMLREVVQTRAPISLELPIRFLDPQSANIRAELGVLQVKDGVGTYRLNVDPRSYVVELIWPDTFLSPVSSNEEKPVRRLRVFPEEWTVCDLNVHGALKPRTPQAQ